MIYNYHAHTFRCHHASGQEKEYIERAISCGIKKMGFSEHAPFMHDDGVEMSYRISVNDVDDYFTTLKALREKYKNQIEIKIGFEIEYYPAYFDKMVNFALSKGAEYFILGQHQIETDLPDEHDGLTYLNVFEPNDNELALSKYIDVVISAVKSGYMSYVAHPDVYHFVGNTDAYLREYTRLVKTCKEYNTPMEINCLGIRDNRYYPRQELWQLIGQIGAPVVIGFDAHDVNAAFDGESIIKAEKMIEKYNLNYIPDLKLKLFNH